MSKKILVCDDDEGILEMVSLILEDFGFEVVSEINSLNLHKLIEIESPDLLIVDLWMPVLSGDQLIKVLKSEELTKNLPVIIISASIEGKKIAEQANADDFIEKPFNIDDLINKVDKLINE